MSNDSQGIKVKNYILQTYLFAVKVFESIFWVQTLISFLKLNW